MNNLNINSTKSKVSDKTWKIFLSIACTIIVIITIAIILLSKGQIISVKYAAGNINKPAKIGETVKYETHEMDWSLEKITCVSNFTLTDTMRGEVAEQYLLDNNIPYYFGSDKDDTNEVYVAKIDIALLTIKNGVDHDLLQDTLVKYSDVCFGATDNVGDKTEFIIDWADSVPNNFPMVKEGQTSKGLLVFLVEKGSVPTIFYEVGNSAKDYIYFKE